MGVLSFVFPGQGAQSPGMGRELYEASPAAKAVLDRAESQLPGLLDTAFLGPMEKLTQTHWAQPALFAVNLACAAAAKEAGLIPRACAGFSLGEWAAVVEGGLLGFEQAFRLVLRRGQWMADCAERHPGGMAAVLRLTAEELQAQLAAFPEVYAVNFNAPGQIVVAGETAPLEAFLERLKTSGHRFIRLNVAGAFHSPLMAPAADRLLTALRTERFETPHIPVYANSTARPYQKDSAAETLALQAASPVRWVETIEHMAANGVDTFLELGPGKVLSGLIPKILPQARVFQADSPAGIAAAKAAIGGIP